MHLHRTPDGAGYIKIFDRRIFAVDERMQFAAKVYALERDDNRGLQAYRYS